MPVLTQVNNFDDMIDSRDIIAILEDWENDEEPRDEDETEELVALRKFAEEASEYAEDWQYGATLIRESYFETYAREYMEETGSIPSDLPEIIANNIDWEGIAEDLKVDYTSIAWDGIIYYVR